MARKKCDVQLARDRFKQAETAGTKQYQREIDDLRFLIQQWPDDLMLARSGQNAAAGLPPVPARPCLTIDTLHDPLAHVKAEAEQTDLGPEIVAADDFGDLIGPIDDTEIELREGLVRKIQRESNARDARNWAADRARKAGQGYYIVLTRYVSERSNDQEVYVDKIYNQSAVRLDPRHEQSDGSDCDWEFYGTDMSWEQYQAEHPDSPLSKRDSVSDDDWRGLGDEAKDWFTTDKDGVRSVRVMNYFWTDREVVTLATLADGRTVPAEQAGDAPRGIDEDGEPIEDRRHVKKTIRWSKIDGINVLDETVIPSPYMPIVKVVWEEVQPFDREYRAQGMVRPARDAAFGVSVMASTEVEVALLAPKTPVTGVAGQFDGFDEAWDQANIRNIGRLEYNAYTPEYPVGSGAPLPPPAALVRNTSEAVGVWDGLRNMFVQSVKSSTGVPDATLGNVDPSVRSGRAIRQLIEQSSKGTSGGLQNLVKSVTYEAKIQNSLLYPIYGRRPGRLMQMMTGKNESQSVLVGQPFVRNEKQRPVPFDPNQHQGQEPKTYQLTPDAEFNVAIRVSKDYDTQRQEEFSMLGELIGANPELMTWFGDLWLDSNDGPGHKEMADRAKLMLAPAIQQQMNGGAGNIPPEVQAQMQQMGQQLQQAQQFIQTKQAEQQGTIEKAKIDAQSKVEIEQLRGELEKQKMMLEIRLKEMDNAKAIEVARINAAKSSMNIAQQAAEERLSTGLEFNQAQEVAAQQQTRELQAQAGEQAHERDMADRSTSATERQSAAQRQHESDMAERAAQNEGGDDE
jgi:hypothetical protein